MLRINQNSGDKMHSNSKFKVLCVVFAVALTTSCSQKNDVAVEPESNEALEENQIPVEASDAIQLPAIVTSLEAITKPSWSIGNGALLFNPNISSLKDADQTGVFLAEDKSQAYVVFDNNVQVGSEVEVSFDLAAANEGKVFVSIIRHCSKTPLEAAHKEITVGKTSSRFSVKNKFEFEHECFRVEFRNSLETSPQSFVVSNFKIN